jgi:hypothetical protein
MSTVSRHPWRMAIPIALAILALILSLVFTFVSRGYSHAASQTSSEPLIQISSDPFHNNTSQHHTEVEPDSFAFGNTIVSAFQQGRFWNGGGSDIGFATSTDGGDTFIHGSLPGLTVFSSPPGIYPRASDASVAFDRKHNVWLISSLGIVTAAGPVDVVVNRSTDGGRTWSGAIPVNTSGNFNDKNWTTCDDTPSSPFYGNCYTEFDDFSATDNGVINMSTSTDGGLTWGPAKRTADKALGIGGQPLVQPSGRVVVPILSQISTLNQVFTQLSFISTNGGKSWSSTVVVAKAPIHVPQGIRATIPLPSSEVDASGKIYSVWQDCRFEKGCFLNDLVLSTSTDGLHWTTPKLIPTDPISSHVDHFIPGLAVDRSTSGSSAHLSLTYYFFGRVPGVGTGNCQTLTCQLFVGSINSTNGGKSWSKKETLAGPMMLQWLAVTTQGYMTGDYISTSIIPGDDDAFGVFAVATPPTGTPNKGFVCMAAGVVCHESTFTTPEDLLKITGGTNTAGDPPAYFPAAAPQSHNILIAH